MLQTREPNLGKPFVSFYILGQVVARALLQATLKADNYEIYTSFNPPHLHVDIVNRASHILEDRLEGHVQVAGEEAILHPFKNFNKARFDMDGQLGIRWRGATYSL